jgi:hypothetical protein
MGTGITDSLQVRVDEVKAVKILQPMCGIHQLWEWTISVFGVEGNGDGNSPVGHDSLLRASG